MGHKGRMLPILGEVLQEESKGAKCIADPFCGSGVVSWYLAQTTDKTIISGDLQLYATIRAKAVVERAVPLNAEKIVHKWFLRAKHVLNEMPIALSKKNLSISTKLSELAAFQKSVLDSREYCATTFRYALKDQLPNFGITCAYGGYYFSPIQAIQLDVLRQTIPSAPQEKSVCIAALIDAASICAASPGHTAQPFQPTLNATQYIAEAWEKDIFEKTSIALTKISQIYARKKGKAFKGDFSKTISHLSEGDLVFADPPYSAVQYSRFYHVLETLAKGYYPTVSGAGRYPPISERPSSLFSSKSQAYQAAHNLLELCAKKGLRLVLTFPREVSSNGLSTEDFINIAKEFSFRHQEKNVTSSFSTLGGKAETREARVKCNESIVCFHP